MDGTRNVDPEAQVQPGSNNRGGVLDDEVSGTPSSTTSPVNGGSTLDKFISLTRRDARDRLDEPPPLPFDIRDHKISVSIFTILVAAECCIVPLVLFYALKYRTNMRSGKSSVPTMVPVEPKTEIVRQAFM